MELHHVQISKLDARHEQQWRRLWPEYLEFYETKLAPPVTARTWQRISGNDGSMIGLGAWREQELVGFAIVVIHDATWALHPAAYLEDLYVHRHSRGAGVGRAIIDHVIGMAREAGWTTVYWHTRADNFRARRLYDTYGRADGYVRYRLHVLDPTQADASS